MRGEAEAEFTETNSQTDQITRSKKKKKKTFIWRLREG